MASSIRLSVRWECERLEGVKNWRKPDMHVSSLGLKTRARPVRLDDGYVVHWRDHKVYMEEKLVKAACLSGCPLRKLKSI